MKEKLKIKKFDKRNFIKIHNEKAIIYIIWQNIKWDIWTMADAINVLKNENINISMISQWMEERAIIIWIEEKDREKVINALHKVLICNNDT